MAGGAKIEQDDSTGTGANVEITGFDVPVQVTLGMDGFQRRYHVVQDSAQFRLGQNTASLQSGAERLADLVFHHDIGGAIGGEVVPHPHHTRMVYLHQDFGFVQKALQAPFVTRRFGLPRWNLTLGIGADIDAIVIAVGPFGGEIFLDRDFVLKRLVDRFVGNAETTGSQDALDLVAVQVIACR